ncbi:mitochondrial import inner membrane translocase subunit Tim29 [Procambarus clarkii]|uniref:mitochondrial import inner membrane translocase subunit Tim29 n=1 Tax=Procambarus clarkii TaxID=6728 RepID=UPI001E674D51|nr:mitochondrial import inner membrane translocase subunit Tim29-like [Procambarus clarkii]
MAGPARSMSSLALKTPWKIKLPSKFKGGSIEKWGNYWASVAQDYKEMVQDVIVDSRRQPLKAATYLSIIAGYICAVKTNPNKMDFQDTLQKYMNESAMLSDKIRNKEVDAHFNYMVDCYNHGLVRRLSLGFCSLLWVDNYSKVCGVFKSQCEYLTPQYLTFHERIMDVGFFGTWWGIDAKMKEFDINPEEWVECDTKG